LTRAGAPLPARRGAAQDLAPELAHDRQLLDPGRGIGAQRIDPALPAGEARGDLGAQLGRLDAVVDEVVLEARDEDGVVGALTEITRYLATRPP
jgi:hypothetical protein